MPDELLMSHLHSRMIKGLIEQHACPSNAELAGQLELSTVQVEELLRDLSQIHGVVLHPHVVEPWVIHPFSLTPTIHWIEGLRRGWWSPCIWCAFGVAALAGGKTRIHTRLAAEAEPVTIPVNSGEPAGFNDLWVHFAIPPAQAWQNVHQHCSMVLAFRSPEEIRDWCERYRLPHGQDVPLPQVAELARLWYGSHADPAWRKWTIAQAQDIFRQAGLIAPFWDLGPGSGRY